MHVYPWHMDPPITTDPCYTVTYKMFYILQNAHIPMTDWPPAKLTIDLCYTVTPSPCQLTIDPCYTVTPSPCQLTIDPCYTVTPHKFHIVHNAHIPMADPYTKAVSHVVECHGRLTQPPPPIKHISLENQYTKYISYIAQCTYTHGRLTPPLLQVSIDLWKTIIPNKFHIWHNAHIPMADWPHPSSNPA